jgi:hypothetical protein
VTHVIEIDNRHPGGAGDPVRCFARIDDQGPALPADVLMMRVAIDDQIIHLALNRIFGQVRLIAIIVPENRDEPHLPQFGKRLDRERGNDVAAVQNVSDAVPAKDVDRLHDVTMMVVGIRYDSDSHRYPP